MGMKVFVVEAAGGPAATDGGIVHYLVHARDAAQAVELVRAQPGGARFDHVDAEEQEDEIAGDVPEVVDEQHGPYTPI